MIYTAGSKNHKICRYGDCSISALFSYKPTAGKQRWRYFSIRSRVQRTRQYIFGKIEGLVYHKMRFFNINLLGMQLFQKLRAPFLGFEAHEDEVA